MEPKRSLPCWQESSTAPYPEPDQSSPYHPILSKIHFNIVTCYVTGDAVQIVNWFIYNLTLTIIYSAVSHLHSLQSYTPVFHTLQIKPSHFETDSPIHFLRLSPAENSVCLAPAENFPRRSPPANSELFRAEQ
jgi:hypothetical protein